MVSILQQIYAGGLAPICDAMPRVREYQEALQAHFRHYDALHTGKGVFQLRFQYLFIRLFLNPGIYRGRTICLCTLSFLCYIRIRNDFLLQDSHN